MMTLAIPTDGGVLVHGPRQGEWTADDWELLPDDGNIYEIIEGVLYVSKSPTTFHQWVSIQLAVRMGGQVHEKGLGFAFFAPTGVFMPGCEPVQPDFLIVKMTNKDIIRDRRVYGVPDLIVEILSPGNREYDLDVKLTTYADAGVPEYVIIDLAARTLALRKLIALGEYGEPQVCGEGDSVSFACAPGVVLKIGDLFAGAPDTTL
jgi:Uma2 family endonuclease